MGVLVIIGLAAAVGYLASLRIHPLTKCRVCKMSGRHFGAVYTNSYRRCRKCGGSGRQDRLGVRLFYGGTNDTGVFPKRLSGEWPRLGEAAARRRRSGGYGGRGRRCADVIVPA